MIEGEYKERLDLLALMAKNFIEIYENGEELSTVLITVGMLTASCADVYNLSPRGGMFDLGSLFTGKQEEKT